MIFFEELVRASGQIFMLSIIPTIVWLVTARKKQSFFLWIGLKKPVVSERGRFLKWVAVAIAVAITMSLVLDRFLPGDTQLANARFAGKGIATLPGAIVFSFLATALPEEILFRGFIGGRLGTRFGFVAGNTIQAVLFGLLHGATLFNAIGFWLPLIIIAFTGTIGWIMGYINRKASGSILPSMVIHGLSNIYSCVIIMFALW
jgi:membrane protease YdiL (CAAX protease family)